MRAEAEDRPRSFLMNGALIAPVGTLPNPADNIVALQMSPGSTGSPFYPDNKGLFRARAFLN